MDSTPRAPHFAHVDVRDVARLKMSMGDRVLDDAAERRKLVHVSLLTIRMRPCLKLIELGILERAG